MGAGEARDATIPDTTPVADFDWSILRGEAMTTTKAEVKLLTAHDLLQLHSEGVRGELVRGVLEEAVSNGMRHGEIVVNYGMLLGNFVKPRRLGRLMASDSGVWLDRDPDTVREPDLAFISVERLPLDAPVPGYAEVVPDLVVEIVSPSDRPIPVFDKAQMWLRYGVRLVWITDPEARTILALPQSGPPRTFTEDDTLDGGNVLPGFTCPVRDIFDL